MAAGETTTTTTPPGVVRRPDPLRDQATSAGAEAYARTMATGGTEGDAEQVAMFAEFLTYAGRPGTGHVAERLADRPDLVAWARGHRPARDAS